MSMNFSNKRILVTGGTRGIGRATAEAFLAAGALVAVNGRTPHSTEEAIRQLAAGERAIGLAGDLAVAEECRRLVERTVAALGALDVLVNNAGSGSGSTAEAMSVEDWDRTMNVNLRAPFLCTQAAIPALRKSKGNIVNVGSILGIRGYGLGGADYCASKGGLVNLTRDLATELGPDIRVNCLCPGAIDTDMLREGAARDMGKGDPAAGYAILSNNAPLKRVAQAGEMARTILYLASDFASFVTGAILVADGGMVAHI
jgi:NAD(P)-dependent dehydrogenase (short-subunit alcohol dehydrogenase family)